MAGRASARPLSRGEAFALGRLGLDQLSETEALIFHAGWWAGRASRDREVERLQWEASRLFLMVNNPGKNLKAYTDAQIDKMAENMPYEEFLEIQDGVLAEITKYGRAA